MNKQVKEFTKRVRLTKDDFDEYDNKAPPADCSICARIHFAEGAKAQLKKVLNDPRFALYNPEGG